MTPLEVAAWLILALSAWLTILLGLSHAIDESPDALKSHFVKHEGKKEIHFRGAGTLESQDWDGQVVPFFAGQIEDSLTEQCKTLFPCDFSTSTEVDKLASHVVMMGAMRHWFDYRMSLACAITEVTVTGTPDDWRRIIHRVGGLGDMGLAWWSDHLLAVLFDILVSCEGRPNLEFWRRIYKRHGYGSGGQFSVSGWINALYPFIAGQGGKMQRNLNVGWTRGGETYGEDFPIGLASCEVIVDDNGAQRTAMLYGGLVGVGMSESLAVQAVSGYAVTVL